MRNILIVGAGKSSPFLIKYLLDKSKEQNLHLHITDVKTDHLLEYKEYSRCNVSKIDILNDIEREEFVEKSDIIISMLPARFHMILAKSCLKFKKNLLTASYVSDNMKSINKDVEKNNLIFLNEMGLDPGIDHMSAKKIIDNLEEDNCSIYSFKSYTGGLIAPESDNNSWNYKFTWNPRNVVLAGQGLPAKYIENKKYKYLPYNRLFENTEKINIDNYGQFEVYPNRDSLKYREIYGLEKIDTMIRGTIRKVGFPKSWNMLVRLGLTDDSFKIMDCKDMSYRDFLNCFLPYNKTLTVEEKIQNLLKIEEEDFEWLKLKEINLFCDSNKVPFEKASPAQILEYILKEAWKLEKDDKDMIVMYHEFKYRNKNDEEKTIISTMGCIGHDNKYTAMAKTVGLPLGISCLLILNEKIKSSGVQTPVIKEIYNPVLKELEIFGIHFNEK
tara:strand:- start:2100 stop:3428 length:1329 start_codon:yes stop_codon:yes gene_type:complete